MQILCQAQGVLTQSPQPQAHDKVLDNSRLNLNLEKMLVLRIGENRSTRRKTSQSKEENQQTQPTDDAGSGN